MPQTHDHAAVRPGRDLEALGDALRRDHQRVVPGGGERIGEAGEERPAVVTDLGRLAVHELRGAHDLPAEALGEGLVAQAHPEDGHRGAADELDADAGLVRRARAGGDHDALGPERQRVLDAHRVVADHLHLGTQLAEVLIQVEGERVVVVDEEDHARPPASLSASKSAWALASVSRSSAPGSESATIPAPAWSVARLPFIVSVRMAMQKSRLPRRSR